MKFLIAGFGSIGRRHLRNLRALGQNDLILLRSNKSTLTDESEISGIPVETTIEAALAHKPDGVIIAVPTALHLDAAIPAAKANCAILMEKPISNSLEQVSELRSALQNGSGRFLMGFQYRFHPGLILARSLLSQKTIGRPISFRAEWGEYLPGWHPWEDYRNSYSARADLGGGVLLTLSHPLDYLRFLFGDPNMIWGFNGKISDLEIETDDIAEIGLQMQNGMVGSVHLNYYRRPVCNRLEVVGTDGVLTWNNDDAIVKVWGPDAAAEPTVYPPREGFERNWLFLNEMRHFIDVTARKAEPSCTLADGIAVQQMVNAVKTSWKTKRFIAYSEESSL